MKLSKIKHGTIQVYREVSYLVTHPWQFVKKFGEKKSEEFLENTQLNWGNKKPEIVQAKQNDVKNINTQSQLNSSWQLGEKLEVNRGDIYTIEKISFLEEREYLYIAKNSSSDSVWIKEYKLLDGDFNQEEILKRQQEFKRLIDLNLKIGHGQDFRIVKLIDAFYKDKSCFLIAKFISNSVTLKEDLIKNGSMTNQQIWEVIKQVLESLLFLHTYRVRFSKEKLEEREGVPHGNINPNSLLIKYTNSSIVPDERLFFIYLTDLALWKHVVSPPGSQLYKQTIAQTSQNLGSFPQDLYDLGRLALVLASGKYDENSWQTIHSEAKQILSCLKNDKFKNFILRLLNQNSSWEVEEALNEIIKIDFKNSPTQIHVEEELPQKENSQAEQILKEPKTQASWLLPGIVFSSLAVILLFFWMWKFFLNQEPHKLKNNEDTTQEKRNCCIQSINLSGKYLIESTWETAINSPVFDSNTKTSLAKKLTKYSKERLNPLNYQEENKDNQNKNQLKSSNKVNQELLKPSSKKVNSQLQVNNNPQKKFYSRQEILKKIKSVKDVKFAFMRISDDPKEKQILTKKGLDSKPLAYDALVIFVAFKYSYNSNKDTPAKVLDGKIKEEELSELYTTGNLKRLKQEHKIKLYLPKDEESITILQNFVAEIINKNQPNNDRLLELLKKQIAQIERLDSKIIFQKVRNNSDKNDTIVIGVDRLSRLFGQCSVYPLAIEKNNKRIQLLKQSNDKDVELDDEDVDLCSDKGSYWPKIDEEYPLAYPLGIVFKEENSALVKEFAKQIMLTDEAQYLLSQVGLVPAGKSIPELRKNLWKEQK